MRAARTILVVMLALWLPLSCCCRLHAMADALRCLVDGREQEAGNAVCCGDRSPADQPNRTDDQAPKRRCMCGDHAAAAVRISTMPVFAESDAVVGTLIDVIKAESGERYVQAPKAGDTCPDGRLKLVRTLLRQHCALNT